MQGTGVGNNCLKDKGSNARKLQSASQLHRLTAHWAVFLASGKLPHLLHL
jgi:hypothetical protein